MIGYKDMTFCPFWEDCAKAKECHRPLTNEVMEAAKRWWGGDDASIMMYTEKPGCHELLKVHKALTNHE